MLSQQIRRRLKNIYRESISDAEIVEILSLVGDYKTSSPENRLWSHKDVILITYGDSIKKEGEKPLVALNGFLDDHLKEEISIVHILPFFPYSSDDGFSVIDYLQVDPGLGTWKEIDELRKDYDLMFDLVINHISSKSEWFLNYLEGRSPGKDFFIEVDPSTDLSMVTRPRSLPLLTPVRTKEGMKHVWTTFSDDQIDLDFSNVRLLKEMLRILLEYIHRGARIIRLDAIAYLWKEIGTSCIHLPETHEMVKLLRDVAETVKPGTIILTETNVPNKENLSYFGDGDEARMIYQFSLPPLLLHALFNGNSKYLNDWIKEVPHPPEGCTYFNFTASHDGIGVRPLEGLLPEEEKKDLYEAVKASGGKISTKRNSDGSDSPYELNITYFDAMKRSSKGVDNYQAERFMASQTVMMALQGIPAFYIHSLLATENYYEGFEETGRARTLNRRKWDYDVLMEKLEKDKRKKYILDEIKRRIRIRKEQKVFGPENPQELIETGENVFALRRQDEKGNELFSITNLTDGELSLNMNKISQGNYQFRDLIEGQVTAPGEALKLAPYQTAWLIKD